MKKIITITVVCLFSVTLFGQLKVETTGKAVAGNSMDVDGIMATGKGVLNVTSNRVSPNYNSMYDWLSLQLIRTVSISSNCVPFVNYYSRTGSYTPTDINFYVLGNGQIYTKTGVLQPAAAATASRSAVPSAALESPLQKLKTLNGIVYREPSPSGTPSGRPARTAADASDSVAYVSGLPENESGEPAVRIGLLAREVEQAFPEVVRELPDGSKGILYTDLIPVLIESIKELQDSLALQSVRIAALEQQASGPASSPQFAPSADGTSGVSGQPYQANGAVLYQNTPNPFNRETEITYRLSAGASAASVCIYNLNGQQLRKYPLPTGELSGKVTVSGSEFAPGMYLYSLVIDNRVIDSKRMTLTD